jgi:hypothetical protein
MIDASSGTEVISSSMYSSKENGKLGEEACSYIRISKLVFIRSYNQQV